MTRHKMKIGQFIFIILLFSHTFNALFTGAQISQKCHCDITSSFCDFACCCDTDCGSAISESCFNSKSSYYCPKTDFFKSIKPSSTVGGICYYFNATTTTIGELSLTNTQRGRLVSENTEILPVASTINTGYKGYKMGSILTIGGKNAFSFIGITGNCINSTASDPSYKLRFGLNAKISCNCNNCGTPLLFSQILGKNIAQFLDLSSSDIQLPSLSYSLVSTLKINFIIGKYGSQKIKYIDRITHSYESVSGSTTRSLYLNFIDSDNIKEVDNSASFFPQIPADMFYPIHVMS